MKTNRPFIISCLCIFNWIALILVMIPAVDPILRREAINVYGDFFIPVFILSSLTSLFGTFMLWFMRKISLYIYLFVCLSTIIGYAFFKIFPLGSIFFPILTVTIILFFRNRLS